MYRITRAQLATLVSPGQHKHPIADPHKIDARQHVSGLSKSDVAEL